MRDRWPLIQRGMFPETLPPCFVSTDLKRAFSGLVRKLNARELHKGRETDYVRYSGTKHDGNRRLFGTPNPVSYFYVASFIHEHWNDFERRFSSTPLSVSRPKLGRITDDRPIVVPSLSELTTVASSKLSRSAFVLKTDIAQFFPIIYTHAIAWSAHGIEQAKVDREPSSKNIYFNKLDFFTSNCQRGETRGVLIGPDAFRLIAEYIASGLDAEFQSRAGADIIGGARHVDDYFIGVRAEPEALAALSYLRDVLQGYNLQINDAKTKTMSGLEPLNDLWAQALRKEARGIKSWRINLDDLILFYDTSLSEARKLKSDSPIKIALRTLDQQEIYDSRHWEVIEPYLQRTLFHHSHCIDYIALIVAKRVALGKGIDKNAWKESAYELIRRHLPLNHHHEVVWLLWLLIVSKLELSEELIIATAQNSNAHIRALIVAAYLKRIIPRKPPIRLGNKLASTDENWLINVVARAGGYSGASFSGQLADEFEHLANKKVRLINFESHMNNMKRARTKAISLTRYGYDGDDYDDEQDDWTCDFDEI